MCLFSLVDLFCSWKWFDQSNPPTIPMMKRSHQIIVNHESQMRLRHNFQELGDLRERAHTRSRSHTLSLGGLQKRNNRRRKTPTIFFHLLLFVLCLRLLAAAATNNCVVRFSRFSPLTVLFCPSHDVCVCVRASVCIKHFTVLFTQHKWKFSSRLCFLLIYSVSTSFILHKTSPNKLILFTFSRSYSAACVTRICLLIL